MISHSVRKATLSLKAQWWVSISICITTLRN